MGDLLYRTTGSRFRDVVIGGHIFEMGNRWGQGKGTGREGGGRSIHKQPGTRVDGNRTTRKGGIPSK
jgi:hypothetical protein